MKLLSVLSERDRQRVSSALETLATRHAGFEAKLAAFAEATATCGSLERQIEGALYQLGLTAEAADALKVRLEATRKICQTRKEAMEEARGLAVDAIRRAGGVVREVAGPLVEQFRRGLAAALQPFCTDAAGAVAALPEHRTELPALEAFLSRGLHVSRRATAEDLEFLRFELGRTLQAILDGGHVWRAPHETAAALAGAF